MPKTEFRRGRRIWWSIVSKAAERLSAFDDLTVIEMSPLFSFFLGVVFFSTECTENNHRQ